MSAGLVAFGTGKGRWWRVEVLFQLCQWHKHVFRDEKWSVLQTEAAKRLPMCIFNVFLQLIDGGRARLATFPGANEGLHGIHVLKMLRNINK